MTGAEPAAEVMDDPTTTAVSEAMSADPAPVNHFRARIEARVRIWRSLRTPTVDQIENAQFWEDYLKKHP